MTTPGQETGLLYSKMLLNGKNLPIAKRPSHSGRPLKLVAERTGLEPATPGVTGRYSNQLNYRSAIWLAFR